MSFDWAAFLDRHGIEYDSKGRELYAHCPMCGSADGGKHMGMNQKNGFWGCWRDSTHRGRRPERLIAALLGVSHAEAARLAGSGPKGLPDAPDAALAGLVASLRGQEATTARPGPRMPPEFSDRWGSKSAYLFLNYLEGERGFSANQIERLIEDYDLRFAMTGPDAYRIIIPVYDEAGELFTWTARAINDDAKVRYKTLTSHPEKAKDGVVAKGPISDMLLDLPRLADGGEMLILVEGPFDALRLSPYVAEFGARVTCLFGKTVSAAQIDLLVGLRSHYKNMWLLVDPDASLGALGLGRQLTVAWVRAWLLDGTNDPGEMAGEEIRPMLKAMSVLK